MNISVTARNKKEISGKIIGMNDRKEREIPVSSNGSR